MDLVIFISQLVTIEHYEGYWTRDTKLVFCSKQNVTILDCEIEECTMNCHDTYEIEDTRIISKRDSNVIGLYDWNDGIRWGNNITWIKKGLFLSVCVYTS